MRKSILVGAVLASLSAHADTTTLVPINNVAQFFDAYDNAPNASARSALELMIIGAEQAIMSANAQASQAGQPLFCEPMSASLSTAQVIQLLRIGYKEDKRYAVVPVGFGLLQAYDAAFPCQGQKAP